MKGRGGRTFRLATRGSDLALAQAQAVLAACQAAFPHRRFGLRIIKTTGDRRQQASLSHAGRPLDKGLFTKELEAALRAGKADLAVHSLKDLPTELPAGLRLAAVLPRADVRDVLIFRVAGDGGTLAPGPPRRGLPPRAGIGTGSTRRAPLLGPRRPDLVFKEIRGNVPTRLQKLAATPELDALVLAAAGLGRLGLVLRRGELLARPVAGQAVQEIPAGLGASFIPLADLLPCVGQAAIGLEIRAGDRAAAAVCRALNHRPTWLAVTAERALLRAFGGGCHSPVGAHAVVRGDRLVLRATASGDGCGCQGWEQSG
ncbi:MAG TPA: hydroxymethylbilane synthase, partial [Verrucomicrobiota bacterium]|nr:hydroxymethylbilane synthase [Verrucomicrobiota bacterium]